MRFLSHIRFFILAMIRREYGIMWREMLRECWRSRNYDDYGSKL